MNNDNPLSTMTAGQVMCQNVITVSLDWTVSQLARFLTDKSISGAPVINSNGQFVGVVSFSDIVRQAGSGLIEKRDDSSYYNEEMSATLSPEEQEAFHSMLDDPFLIDDSVLVNDIMTPMMFEVSPDTPLMQVAEAMVKGRIHRVMVTESRTLKGVISALDLLKVITL